MLSSARSVATRPINGRFATSRSPAAPNTQITRPAPPLRRLAGDVQGGCERNVGVGVVHYYLESAHLGGGDPLEPSRHLPHLSYGAVNQLLPHPQSKC